MERTELDYVSGRSILPENAFGISPSQLYHFFDKPHLWYREQVLDETAEFQGSTSSYIGTIVHYVAQKFAQRQAIPKSEIYKYLYNHLVLDKSDPLDDFSDPDICEEYLLAYADHPTISVSDVIDQYKPMGNALMSHLNSTSRPTEVEQLVSAQVIPGYYVAGSCDAYDEHTGTVIDYKTTSDKSPKQYIPYNYKLQLLCYAYIYHKINKPVNHIAITWITRNEVGRISPKTGKPLQDYPSQTSTVTEPITADDILFIESLLKLVAETVKIGKENPNLVYLLYKDYRLKLPEVRKNIFKKD